MIYKEIAPEIEKMNSIFYFYNTIYKRKGVL